MEPVGGIAKLWRRLGEEDGFTLTELLSAQVIGGFVVAAAISMVMVGFNATTRIADRVNSAAQGRVAMEEIQQRLRSQTCLYSSEYLINSATQSTSSSISFLHASPSKIVFFNDIGNTQGNTAATTAVGFQPQMRFIYVDPGPTSGAGANRRAKFIDGLRNPTNSSIPFVFNIGTLSQLSQMAPVTGIASVTPSTMRAFAEGVTNDVSGSTTLPIFRYYDDDGDPVPTSADGSISAANLSLIADVEVSFQILGLSGKDGITPPSGSTGKSDDRTSSFNNDIYLKTSQTACE